MGHTALAVADRGLEPVPAAQSAMPLNKSGIEPLDVKVIVKPDAVEEVTAGGIIKVQSVADKEKYAATRGTLIAVGPNAFREWGAEAAPKVGTRVLYAQYAGSRFEGEDKADYIVMNDEDVIGSVAA